MGSEILIYGYGLVCLSMLAFNIIYSVWLRSGPRRGARRVDRVAAAAGPGLAALESGSAPDSAHLTRMEALLARVNNLLAFDEYLQSLPAERAGAYLDGTAPIFTRLAGTYLRREETQGAYFCHFIAKWGRYLGRESRQLAAVISGFTHDRGLYSRVNALRAICALGEAEILMDTLLSMNQAAEEGIPIHEKIAVETLMAFNGDYEHLISLIWERFERFRPAAQRMLLDYIRFRSGGCRDEFLPILLDSRRDKELRLSAIRYFGRYPDERARAALLAFVSDPDQARWEYAAISASSLAAYPGDDTVDALSGAMHSPNWYVRYNSASSLERLGFSYEDLLGKAAFGDRYAREMLTYRLETRRLNAEREKSKEVVGA